MVIKLDYIENLKNSMLLIYGEKIENIIIFNPEDDLSSSFIILDDFGVISIKDKIIDDVEELTEEGIYKAICKTILNNKFSKNIWFTVNDYDPLSKIKEGIEALSKVKSLKRVEILTGFKSEILLLSDILEELNLSNDKFYIIYYGD